VRQVGDRIDARELNGQRWFAAQARPISGAVIEERFDLPGGGAIAILRVEAGAREVIRYTLPLESGPPTWRALVELASSTGTVSGASGWSLEGIPPVRAIAAAGARTGPVRPLEIDQSHTSWVVDDAMIKLFRRLAPGRNPEVELAAALARDPSAPVPLFRGALRVVTTRPGKSGDRFDVAVVQRFVADAGDEFERLADGLAAWLREGAEPGQRDDLTSDLHGIGRAVADLHRSLGGLRGRALGPRAVDERDRRRWRRAAERAPRQAVASILPMDPAMAAEIGEAGPALQAALRPLGDAREVGPLTRIHGDLHIGQVIREGHRFLVTDLEGEPSRPVAARRRVDLPLRDVASMLRSIDHVARSASRRAGTNGPAGTLDGWIDAARAAFLDGYGAPIDGLLLHALEVEKELYEFTYAASYLPEWRYAPAGGLRWLLARGPS
jgi:trehalose synthase-fused probable maltokinase